jgi:ech hydrogenase subunit C
MHAFRKSPWILHYDASSCNGCDIEVVASLTPMYDVERLGVINTGNPKHADIFLVTGSVNAQNLKVLRTLYEQMPEPRVVVAVGICATSGCVFRECYNVMGGVDTVLPVDLYVPGCAARPESIIDGVIQAVGLLEKKRQFMKAMRGRMQTIVIERATPLDAPEILALQKIVYQNEAEMYEDWTLTPLKQTLAEMRVDFESKVFIKAVVGGKIVGSVRGYMVDTAEAAHGDIAPTAHITRLIVLPYFWQHGIGTKLVREIEGCFPQARRFETFMGQKSRHTMEPYQKLGYVAIRQEKVSEQRDRVYFAKERNSE